MAEYNKLTKSFCQMDTPRRIFRRIRYILRMDVIQETGILLITYMEDLSTTGFTVNLLFTKPDAECM